MRKQSLILILQIYYLKAITVFLHGAILYILCFSSAAKITLHRHTKIHSGDYKALQSSATGKYLVPNLVLLCSKEENMH